MEIRCINVHLHPRFLYALFAYKNEVSLLFKDVLGLHQIDHIAINRINSQGQLLIFSSTPALEYNLFAGQLWTYDQTYHRSWFQSDAQNYWHELYAPERYDELYYLKQLKHHYPVGISITKHTENEFFIYSFASRVEPQQKQSFFTANQDDFYKIGHYCAKMLAPLFKESELL